MRLSLVIALTTFSLVSQPVFANIAHNKSTSEDVSFEQPLEDSSWEDSSWDVSSMNAHETNSVSLDEEDFFLADLEDTNNEDLELDYDDMDIFDELDNLEKS